MKDRSKYRSIADYLRNSIHSGILVSGEPFYTRKELCEKYNISLMTAFNVQKLLQDEGLISLEPGVGFFVNRPEMYRLNHPDKPVRQIRMIGSPQAIGENAEFGSELVSGVRKSCEEHGLQLNMELVQVLNNPGRMINTSRRLEPDEALLIFLHDELLPEVVNLLMSPYVRAVTVIRTFPDKPAILPDFKHAMGEILEFCRRKKARKILYVGQCNYWIILMHESEFFQAFMNGIGDFDFEYETDFSGNLPAIAEHIKRSQPDVVIFSHDDGAEKLRDRFFPDPEKRPLFVGFGDFPSMSNSKKLRYTYKQDGEAMGRAAVETLLKPDLCILPPLYQRIKGQFIERD